jgi:TetR/AcrR family fatty acid metabolism transcriptional regulator
MVIVKAYGPYDADQPGLREQRKNEKKMAIEKASEKIFLKKGYSAASMDEIASLAGVTKRTLYSYYPSKLSLFVHVFDAYLQELSEELKEAAGEDLPVDEVLVNLAEVLFAFSKKNEKFMRLYWMLDSPETDGIISQELVEHVRRWTEMMMDEVLRIVEKGQAEGVIGKYDPRLLVHLFSAVNKGILIHSNKEKKFEIADIEPESLQGLFIRILGDGLFSEDIRGAAGQRTPRK